MELMAPLRCLDNSISRFIHLVTSRVSKKMAAEADYITLASLLKHLKQVLGEVNQNSVHNEAILKESEELDTFVNDAREFLEKCSPRTSKILYLLQSKPLIVRIHTSALKLCKILVELSESSSTPSNLSNAELCMQNFQNVKLGNLTQAIEEILSHRRIEINPTSDDLLTITESLYLKSNQEIFDELIALQKEKQKKSEAEMEKAGDNDIHQISQALDLLSHIRHYLAEKEKNIQIPSYFLCPLSLQLMSDPVIVASGQTYERSAIQKWLDHGLKTCPETGLELAHENLIPNHTVRALIANWCGENNVEICKSSGDVITTSTVQSRVVEHVRDESDAQSPQQSDASYGLKNLEIDEEGSHVPRQESGNSGQLSSEHSYVHSRSESISSVVSSSDYHPPMEVSRQFSSNRSISDPKPASTSSNKGLRPSLLSEKPYSSSKTMSEMAANGNHSSSRARSFSYDSNSNDLTSASHVEELIEGLKSPSSEQQTASAQELRFLTKYNVENRSIVGQCGAIPPLVSLLHSAMDAVQEHSVTALLNLSIEKNIKSIIAEEGAVEPLIHVLKTGNPCAKENAAAALFSISLLDEYRVKIGRSGAVKPLVDLLHNGTVRGKKDALTALFNLSIFHENKARIVQAGAVRHLVASMEPSSEMVDKSLALLANLSSINEGCKAIAKEGGIPLLVENVEMGSQRGKENAASILLQLCINSMKHCKTVLQEGAVPPLVALSQSGTPRAKEKAQQLLNHFRNQRESAAGRGRS